MGLALNLEPLDERKHEIGRAGAETVQCFPAFAAKSGDHLARIELQPGNHLTAVAAGSAEARLLGFEEDGLRPAFSKMQRRG